LTRALILSDCKNGLSRLETAYRTCHARGRRTNDATLECICELIDEFELVVLLWVPGHSGASMNSYADACAKAHAAPITQAQEHTIMKSISDHVTSRPCMYQIDVHNKDYFTTCDTNTYQLAKDAMRHWLDKKHATTTTTITNLWTPIPHPWLALRKRVNESLTVYDRSSRKNTTPIPDQNDDNDEAEADQPWSWTTREVAITRTGLINGIHLNQVPGIEGGARIKRFAASATSPNQPSPRELSMGCVAGCTASPDPRHVISGGCMPEPDRSQYLTKLRLKILNMINAIPKNNSGTPCECKSALIRALDTVKVWQKSEKETDTQWHSLVLLITATLPTCQAVRDAPPKSTIPKHLTLKLARHIVDLQTIITQQIETRRKRVAKSLQTRRECLNKDWQAENTTNLNTKEGTRICCEAEIARRALTSNIPHAHICNNNPQVTHHDVTDTPFLAITNTDTASNDHGKRPLQDTPPTPPPPPPRPRAPLLILILCPQASHHIPPTRMQTLSPSYDSVGWLWSTGVSQ
jgi:hypothetical protein